MNMLIHNSGRLDYLDAARAFALILGVVFHASLSFMPMYIGWAVMDVSTSSLVSFFVLVSHSFRMPLFFLIAGYFSHAVFYRDGAGPFLHSRFIRIVVPFIVAWFVLRPLLVSGWIMGAESMRGEANVPNALLGGFASLASLPTGIFTGTHLWFLYALIWITLCVLLLRFIVSCHKGIYTRVAAVCATGMRWASQSQMALCVLAVPTSGCLWFMSHWGMETPDKTLVPHAPTFCIYGGFYLFGWMLNKDRSLLDSFATLTVTKWLLCVVAVGVACFLSKFEAQKAHSQYVLFKVGFGLAYALMMWSLVSITLGVFRRFFNKTSAYVRYLADASYWLYLIHLPIVIWMQIAFAELPLHWVVKLGAISGITVAISLLLYELFVRSTFIGAVLNGKRKPRAWSAIMPVQHPR